MAITYTTSAPARIIIDSGFVNGTATGGTTTTLVDSTKNWTTNQMAGRAVWNKTTGESRRIVSNTATTLTINSQHPFPTAPVSGNVYSIGYTEVDIQAANDAGSWGVCRALFPIGISINTGVWLENNGHLSPSLMGNFAVRGSPVGSTGGISIRLKQGSRFEMGRLVTNDQNIQIGTEGGVMWLGEYFAYDWQFTSDPGDIGQVLLYGVTASGDNIGRGQRGVLNFYLTPQANNISICSTRIDIRDLSFSGTISGIYSNNNVAPILERIQATSALAAGRSDIGLAPVCRGFIDNDLNNFTISGYSIWLALNGGFNILPELLIEDYSHQRTLTAGIINAPGFTIQKVHKFRNAKPGSKVGGGAINYDGSFSGANGRIQFEHQTSYQAYPRSGASFLSGCVWCALDNAGNHIASRTADGSTVEHLVWRRHSSIGGTINYSEASFFPFTIRVRRYGYLAQEFARELRYQVLFADDAGASKYGEIVPMLVNSFVVANAATAAGYTGVAINGVAKTITVSSARTLQEVYDYSQSWAADVANVRYDVPLTTTDGITFTLASSWTLSGTSNITFGSQNLAGFASVQVSNTISGDRVLVTRADGSNNIIKDEYTPVAASSGATSLTIVESIKSDTPAAGVIRIKNKRYIYTSFNAGTKTFNGLSPALVENIVAADDVFVPLIDAVATGSSVSASFNYSSSFAARVDVRNGSSLNPLVPFVSTINVGTTGGSVSVVRTADI